jgi:hypothetical protein
MKKNVSVMMVALLFLITVVPRAAGFEMTPAAQAELDKMKTLVAGWAADPVIVKAVVLQNTKGPIEGIDNAKWKIMRRSDPLVKEFQSNPAGLLLKSKLDGSSGIFTEAFLSAAEGEKVTFVEKTTSYIHKGQPKFDIPFGGAKSWQGKPEFDESAQTYQIQISVPVVHEAKPVGVLVVGVNLEKLAKK